MLPDNIDEYLREICIMSFDIRQLGLNLEYLIDNNGLEPMPLWVPSDSYVPQELFGDVHFENYWQWQNVGGLWRPIEPTFTSLPQEQPDSIDRLLYLQEKISQVPEMIKDLSRILAYALEGDFEFTEGDARVTLQELRQVIKKHINDLENAISYWWELKTEEFSLSQLRTERLINETYASLREQRSTPAVAKITLPFGKWNKILGETASTTMKWELLALFKKEFGHDNGRVTFMDSTAISLMMNNGPSGRRKLERLVAQINKKFSDHLRTHLALDPGLKNRIKVVGDTVFVISDEGSWVSVDEVFTNDVFVGVARVGKPMFADAAIRRAVHSAEILARARAENAQERFQRGESTKFIDGSTAGRRLPLGRGYFPEGSIPTQSSLQWSVFEILRRYAHPDQLQTIIHLPHAQFVTRVFSSKGLSSLYGLAVAINNLGLSEGGDLVDTLKQVFIDYLAAVDADEKKPFHYFKNNLSYNSRELISNSLRLLEQSPKEAEALYDVIYAAADKRPAHRLGRFRGRDGAVTFLRQMDQELGELILMPWDRKMWGSDLPTLSEKIEEKADLLQEFVDKDIKEAFEDSRFPGKIKNKAFLRVAKSRLSGKDLTYIVFDFDNLSNFMKNPANLVKPNQKFDLSKYQLEALVFEVAIQMGLTPNVDVFYSSPGGDEIEILYSDEAIADGVDAELFISNLRSLVEERFGHIQSPASRKVWVELDGGKSLQRWPIYSPQNQPPYAVDLQDEDRLNRYLNGASDLAGDPVRAFRIIPGLPYGGLMLPGVALESFSGAERGYNTVGVSATYEHFPHIPGEMNSEFVRRAVPAKQRGLHIIDKLKNRYGRNQTWRLHGELETTVMSEGQREKSSPILTPFSGLVTPGQLSLPGLSMTMSANMLRMR